MSYCLPPDKQSKFIQALKDGAIDPGELANMSSADRRAFFEKLVGPDDAKEVNAMFESKLLLKNQQAGLINWAKQITGIKTEAKRDIISKIERMDTVLNPGDEDSFLQDLASKRLGSDVTFDEAKQLTTQVKAMQDAKSEIDRTSGTDDKSRLNYGIQTQLLKDYITSLKGNNKLTVSDVAGASKYLNATLDLSATLAQNVKILYKGLADAIGGNPATLKSVAGAFKNSIGAYIKEVGKGEDAMLPVRARVLGSENALNGKYAALGKGSGLNIDTEEQFPGSKITHGLESIPILGRVLRGAEAAFNAPILRVRQDLADALIKKADEAGIDTLDKNQMKDTGNLVGSMTGRGRLPGDLEAASKTINALLFSVKFLKSNYDMLVAPVKGLVGELTDATGITKSNPGEVFARRQAATSSLKIITTMAAVYTLANLLHPGSAQLDPTNTNFGKIKIGDNYFDITGKMGSLAVLAARIATGKYTSASGKVTDLYNPKYGQSNALDVLSDFMYNRASPAAGIVIDALRGQTYQGTKPTIGGEALKSVTPIPIQQFEQLQQTDEDTANKLGAMILDSLGAAVTQPYVKPKKKK